MHRGDVLSEGVERIDNAVHRRLGEWSGSVHRLLLHLEARGFRHAPRFLGVERGYREIVSWVPGEVHHYPVPAECWSSEALAGAAKLLRRYHDATTDFPLQTGDHWKLEVPSDQPREVICHNDFAHYNCVFRGAAPVGIIDFDTAAPGSRGWDIAHAVYRFVPLCDPAKHRMFGLRDRIDENERLATFLSAYGATEAPFDVRLILRRVQAVRQHTAAIILNNEPGADRCREEKHLDAYDADLEYLQSLFLQ